MALTVNFSVASNITTPTVITLADTSTGTDNTITQRRVYLQKADGSYLTPKGSTTNYITWIYADSTIAISVLDQDYALNITVQWLASSTIAYTKATLAEFNNYAVTYRIKLLKAQASNPRFINSQNFFQVESNVTTYIDGANSAVSIAGDIDLAQLCNEKNKVIIANPKLVY